MRPFLLSILAAILLTAGNAEVAFAQRHEIPALNSCIREFYDPGMYNYLTFKNNCTQSLTLVFVAKDGSGASGSMDLRPGGKTRLASWRAGARRPATSNFTSARAAICPWTELVRSLRSRAPIFTANLNRTSVP